MNDVERELRAMLEERAQDVAGTPGAERTLRRARRRRVVTAGAAVALSLVIVTGAVAAIGRFGPEKPVPSASHGDGGPFPFTTDEGEYPYVATGRFRDTEWKLRAAAVRADADSRVRVTLELSGDVIETSSFEVGTRYDTLVPVRIEQEDVPGDEAAAVFGVVVPEAARVDVELDGGKTTIPARLFSDHDTRTDVAGSYYVVFVPPGAVGYVYARDEYGSTLARRPLGAPRSPEGLVTNGRVQDTNWYLTHSEGGSGGPGRPGETCLTVTDTAGGEATHCIEPDELGRFLYVSFLDTQDVRVVVALLHRTIDNVQMRIDGRESLLHVIPVGEGKNALRLVAVGLPHGTKGRLDALDEGGYAREIVPF